MKISAPAQYGQSLRGESCTCVYKKENRTPDRKCKKAKWKTNERLQLSKVLMCTHGSVWIALSALTPLTFPFLTPPISVFLFTFFSDLFPLFISLLLNKKYFVKMSFSSHFTNLLYNNIPFSEIENI